MEQGEVYNLALKYANEVVDKYGIDDPEAMAKYLTGVAHIESKFDENAKNKHSSALGLMQMLSATQKEVETKRLKVEPADHSALLDPDYAMQLAAYEFGYQYKRYKGDWQKAIHSYNQGSFPGGHPNDGKNYAQNVLSFAGNDDLFADMNFGKGDRAEFY